MSKLLLVEDDTNLQFVIQTALEESGYAVDAVSTTGDAMERLGATRNAITAVLGPTIGPRSYAVGPEFSARFLDHSPDNARFFAGGTFDLPGYVAMRLRAAGIGRFADLALDTYADEERFFSYRRSFHRREADYGRLVAAIALL